MDVVKSCKKVSRALEFRSMEGTKIKTVKISSEGLRGDSARICTLKNIPLYGTTSMGMGLTMRCSGMDPGILRSGMQTWHCRSLWGWRTRVPATCEHRQTGDTSVEGWEVRSEEWGWGVRMRSVGEEWGWGVRSEDEECGWGVRGEEWVKWGVS